MNLKGINIIILLITIMFTFFSKANAKYEKLIYDFKIDSLTGEIIDFSQYKDKAILIVNVASKCGFTKQYEDLQKIWIDYKKKGLVVVGFPSNQFGKQEPGSSKEIKEFCETNFNINFPMSKKIDVKGNDADPIFIWAKNNHGNSAIPKWNFHKILIDKSGKVRKTYSSFVNPQSEKIISEIEKILK